MKLRLFIDGASRGNPGPSAIGIVVQDGRGRVIAEVSEALGKTTNNVAEYEALLRALEEARAHGADEVEILADSDLLVRQIAGAYRVKSPNLAPLHRAALDALVGFRSWRVTHIPRGQNTEADALANRALDGLPPRNSPPSTPGAGTGLRSELARLSGRLNGVLGVGVKTVWDGQEIFLEPDRPFPTASVFKIPVLIELLLQVEEGRLRLDDTVTVTEEMKSPGSGVLKELTSSPSLSLGDLAMLMTIISDNTATDILVDLIGKEGINQRLASLGFSVTRVQMSCRELLFELAGRPTGPFSPQARLEVEQILKIRERSFTGRAYADQDNDLTTPREMVGLLEMLVRDGPLSAGVREQALHFMGRQQVRDRLPLHLPTGAKIAHKTGSIAGVRNDAGILFVPRGPVLVCAFARDLGDDQAGAAAIAEVGRLVHAAFA